MKRDNKIKVCRILAVVFLCFWTISGVRVLAQNATSILDKAASAYEDSNGLTAYFTIQTRSDVLLLRSYEKGFTAKYKGESTSPSGKAAHDIELVPKKKSDIVRVELQIEKFSGLPASIAVFSKNGISSTIRISKMKTGVNQPDSYFVFNEKDYPDAEIIDLR